MGNVTEKELKKKGFSDDGWVNHPYNRLSLALDFPVYKKEVGEDLDVKKKGFSDDEIKIIKAGTHHQELGLPWDQPVPEELWTKVAEYCDNDVIATSLHYH